MDYTIEDQLISDVIICDNNSSTLDIISSFYEDENERCTNTFLIGNNLSTKKTDNAIVIGNNISTDKSNKVYLGNTIWGNKIAKEDPIDVMEIIKKLNDRISELESEVLILREMITWHPDNEKSMSYLKEHFNSLAESQK